MDPLTLNTEPVSTHVGLLVRWYNILITNSRSSNIWITDLSLRFRKTSPIPYQEGIHYNMNCVKHKRKNLQISCDVFVVLGHKVCRRLYDESITSLPIFGTKCLNPAKLFTINLIRAGDCSALVHVECGPGTGTRCHETFQNHQKNLNISPIFENILIGDCI